MELVISQFVNGISGSAELFLVAIGLVITFGMLDVVNMAHGELIMLGAYCGCVCVNVLHLPFALAAVLSFVLTGLLGAVIEHFLIRKIYGKVAETLLVTFALTYIIQQIVRMIFGPENQNLEVPIKGSLHLGAVTIPYYNLFLIIMAVVVLLATLFLFYKTSYGMQLRAITQNRKMTQCLGINSSMIDKVTFSYGSALAGLAGILIAPVSSVSPGMGTDYVVDSFLVVILGGLNSILGSFFGSVVIQEAVSVMASFMSLVTAKLLIFVVIIILIRFKPQGLFSAKDKR
ncbi:MAG: urea ABC transporter permease subunit UrtB [Lachnospiraceae bacterium]|nr:urea ABC transporter permease subunit UrtB [Lachnospiraceae bacterium]